MKQKIHVTQKGSTKEAPPWNGQQKQKQTRHVFFLRKTYDSPILMSKA